MPNLDYDPHNPADLLDRPLAVNDIIAWATMRHRSPAICVARIDQIKYQKKAPPGYDKVNVGCVRQDAEFYELVIEPIKSTGRVTTENWRWSEGEFVVTKLDRPKLKVIKLVKNVVKLNV